MMTAAEARKKSRAGKWDVICESIEYAVSEGEPLCFVRTRASNEELATLHSLGYEARVDEAGYTWVYWGMKHQLEAAQ